MKIVHHRRVHGEASSSSNDSPREDNMRVSDWKLRTAAWICISLLAIPALVAQQDTGIIAGVALDPTGSPVPGVSVKIINTGTNLAIGLTTDQTGNYASPPLRIGVYRVEAEAAGFKKLIEDNIELRVQDRLAIDLHMEVGQVNETVEVTGTAPMLQTQTSSLGQVMETKSIGDVPLNGRNWMQLITLSAGVFVPQKLNTAYFNPVGYAENFVVINGNRAMQNTFLLDGINNNTTDNSVPATYPPPDAIAEFKVQTNAMPAEFGRAAGGVINMTIKSGANEFHGDAYEFLRNQILDANDFFNAGHAKPELRQNQFGATLGGPIKKEKTFFFVDYQGTRLRQGHSDLVTVPTAAQRTGNFTGATVVYDPLTSASNGSGNFTRTPFPGDVIPANRISASAAKVVALYPVPTSPGALANNFIGHGVLNSQTDQFDVRVDQQISQKDSMFGRASASFNNNINPGSLVSVASGNLRYPTNGGLPTRSGAYGYTHVFSPSLVNEFRTGYARLAWFGQPQDTKDHGADLLGIPGVPDTNQTFGLPAFNIAGLEFLGDQTLLPVTRGQNVFHLLDNLSWTRGRHSFKMGGDMRRTQFNINQPGGPRGSFTFDGVFTRQPVSPAGTGSGAADLLLGYADSATLSNSVTIGVRIHAYSGFFQDDWKVSKKLTLNLGLRYENITPPWEVRNRQLTFNFQTNQVVFAKDGSWMDKAFTDRTNDDFAPRVGFAYALTPKTVIRGAYGIFYAFEDNGTFNPAFNFPFRFSAVYPSDQINPSSAIRLDTGFPATALTQFVPANQSLGIRSNHLVPAYIQQWNYTMQREIGSFVLSASYVGNKGTHLARSVQRNQPVPGPGNVNDRRPVLGYGSITSVDSSGNSIYHGLLLTAERRFNNGFSFLLSYTFSKAIEDSGSPALDSTPAGSDQPQDPRNLRLDRGLSPHDVRNRFVYSYVYEFPVGKGKRFLGGAPRSLDLLLGGWQVNGVTTLQSGRHFTFGESFDVSNTGSSNARPNEVSNPDLPASQRTLQRFFDTSAIALQTPYTYGNAGRATGDGPGQVNFDWSLFKNFHLNPESKGHFRPDTVQFRAEFFNILNTPQFDIPNRLAGTPQFGSITGVVNSQRQVQFSLKLLF
jgi:hypothetical protein